MLLKNNVARLITINGLMGDKGQRVEKFQVLPGNNAPTEVPNSLCGSGFVKSLIASGALIVLSEDDVTVQGDPTKPDLKPYADPTKPDLKPYADPTKPDLKTSLYADFDKAQLIAQCEARGIEVKSRDTADKLIEKLETADE